jgi:hypothetical protein
VAPLSAHYANLFTDDEDDEAFGTLLFVTGTE